MRIRLLIPFLIAIFHFTVNGQDHALASDKPKLIVGIVVSEMRYDYIERYWDHFGEDGFKKLIRKGSYCRNVHHDYMIPGRTTGLATIATGAYPSTHGVVADYWYNQLTKEIISAVDDANANPIGGSYDEGKYSPRNILISTLSDELNINTKFASKVISISPDPRAAVVSGGHTADYSFWYDDSKGWWMTSDFYADSLPRWVDNFNNKHFADLYLEKEWKPLYPVYEYTANLNDIDPHKEGLASRKKFPYSPDKLIRMKRKQKDYSILKYTPYGNSFTKDFAITAILEEHMGIDDTTDWLQLHFTSGAYAGDLYSSWSSEMEDIYLRLDRDIAHLLQFLDEQIGMENVLVYLTAENAASNEPAYLQENNIPAGYFNYNGAISLLNTYLNAIYGTGDWVRFYYAQQIYLDHLLIDDSKLLLSEFQDRVARFMVQFEGVSNVLTSEALNKTNYARSTFEKIQKSFHQKRSGDILIDLNPGWVEKGARNEYASSSHYDAHVPLIWYGWNMEQRTITKQLSVTDIMATIASLLNIPRPAGMEGEIIPELIP